MRALSWHRLVLVVGFALCNPVPAMAQATDVYPSKPITYDVFFPPGGRSDIVARLLSPYLGKYLGTPVVVTNAVGGAGVVGHKAVRDAKPDGYTLAQSGATVILQYTRPGISISDYAWVAYLYSVPHVIAVPARSPFKSLKELVDFARANPKKLRHGNTGMGLTTHLCSAAFGGETGVQFTEIAYKGEGPAITGIASGEVDLSFSSAVGFRPMVEAGKLRLLAITTDKRSKEYPQLPTFKELGYNFTWDVWEAVFGPKGLKENKAVYAKLTEAFRKLTADPEVEEKLRTIVGADVQFKSGEVLEKWLSEHDRQIKKTIFDLGIQYK